MKRALGLALRTAVLLVLIALIAFAILALQIDRLGGRDDAQALGAPAADTIVVLGARVNADGSPGSDLTSRTYHAVDLWLAGYAPHIICTGGFKNERLSAAAVCRRFAIELGVPADRVYLADGSSNTIEDAAATARVMADQGWRKAILVSHPLHLYRARWLFRRSGWTSSPARQAPKCNGSHRRCGPGTPSARRPRFSSLRWTGGKSCRRNGSPAYSVGRTDCSRLGTGTGIGN